MKIALDLRDLALFVRTVAGGNLSAAGRELGLSPAMASKRVAQLEQHLGTRLLHRTTRKVTPTEDGLALHDHAQRILAEVAAAEASVGRGAVPHGILRVSAPTSFGRLHLSPAMLRFLQRYPELTLDLQLTDSFVDMVEAGIDVAVRISALHSSTLIARKLAPNRRLICAAPDYLARRGTPRRPQDLAEHNCLIIPGMETWSFTARDGAVESVRVGGSLRTNSGDLLRDAVLGGVGIAMKSTWDVGEALQTGALVPLLTDHRLPTDVAVWAVYPSSRVVAPKVRAFIDFCVAAFGPLPYWDRGLEGVLPD